MEAETITDKAVYKTVVTREKTVVFLPKNAEIIPAHTYGDPPYTVPEHYHRGICAFGCNEIGVPIYVNVHYFGFTAEHLGKNVSGTVSIKLKTKGGRHYLIVDVHRDKQREKERATWALKIGADVEVVDSNNIGDLSPVIIPGSDKCVLFKRLK